MVKSGRKMSGTSRPARAAGSAVAALTSALVALFLCAACDEEQERQCRFAGDGICDEPVNCVLGSDDADCEAACASGESLHLFAAACAFRDPPEEPVDDGDPSGGTVHLTGHRDGTLIVPDGDALTENVERHYRLYVPPAYDPSRSTPLVIVMPGHRDTHYALAAYTEIPRLADENRFIVAYAEQQYRWASEHKWAWFTDWTWLTNAEANPDVAYLHALIDRVASEYNVDRRRIYLAGHSRGGAMAFMGAIEMSDVIAGACVQSGFQEFGYLAARLSEWEGRKVPMVFVHGINDTDVSVSMGDLLVERLAELGWVVGEDYVYYRLEHVTHRWQPWLNQQWWEFLSTKPLPEGG
jgi:predicted esterase